jgi:hypothetical protein
MNSQLVIESISLECDPFSQLCPEHESEKNIVQLELPQIGEMIPQVSQTGSLEDGRNGLAPMSELEQQRGNFGNAWAAH